MRTERFDQITRLPRDTQGKIDASESFLMHLRLHVRGQYHFLIEELERTQKPYTIPDSLLVLQRDYVAEATITKHPHSRRLDSINISGLLPLERLPTLNNVLAKIQEHSRLDTNYLIFVNDKDHWQQFMGNPSGATSEGLCTYTLDTGDQVTAMPVLLASSSAGAFSDGTKYGSMV